MPDLQQLREDRQEDIDLLVSEGLAGCYAMGYVPGSERGKIRPADPHHKALAACLLRVLRREQRLRKKSGELL